MDPAWVGVIGALGGVIVGAVGEGLRANATFRREKRWAAVEENRRRLEMIYEALEQVGESYGQSITPILLQLASGRANAQPPTADKIPWAHLRMLVNLYRPSLLPLLAKVESAGPELGEAMARAVMSATGDFGRDRPLGDKVMAKLTALNQTIGNMRDAIVDESRELDRTTAALIGESQR